MTANAKIPPAAFLIVAIVAFSAPYLLTLPRSPSFQGQLLVATNKLDGSPFESAVVYLIKHDETGAYGLVINRPSGKTAGAAKVRIFSGGPVDEDKRAILHSHDVTAPASLDLPAPNNDLAVTEVEDSTNNLLALIAQGQTPRFYRVTEGYVGWGPGQIEGEMRRGHWMTAPYNEAIVFSDHPETAWGEINSAHTQSTRQP